MFLLVALTRKQNARGKVIPVIHLPTKVGGHPIQGECWMAYRDFVSRQRTALKRLTFKDAIRIKSAEFWLKLGQPAQALSELQRLPRSLWNHPSVRLVLHALCRAN